MYNALIEHKQLIEHVVENQIKPQFKNCKVHVSNMHRCEDSADIYFDVGLISNVIHTNGHTNTPDPLRISILLTIYNDSQGLKKYKLSIVRYEMVLDNGKMFYGPLVTLVDHDYVTFLRWMLIFMSTVEVMVYQHRDKLLIRDDIKHLYI